MANVVRFTLDTVRTLYVPGAGTFVNGVLDVDANNLALLTRTRYLVQPYRAVEIGIVDSGAPVPTLPATPGPPPPDPYPQYLTPGEASISFVPSSLLVISATEPVAPVPGTVWIDNTPSA